jgi:hypothetical protein
VTRRIGERREIKEVVKNIGRKKTARIVVKN